MTVSQPPVPTPGPRLWSRVSLFARAQIIGWGLFAAVDLINRLLTYQNLTIALILSALAYPILMMLSAVLRRIYIRLFPSTELRLPVFLSMVALSAAASALTVLLLLVVRHAFGWEVPYWGPLEEVSLPFFYYCVVLIGWSLLVFWIRSDRQRRIEHEAASAAQAEALRAEIQQLRLQINPHFLFNALNGIAEEIVEDSKAALEMLRDLTDYLRHVLESIRVPVVSIEAEIAALAAYLRIQEARFGPKLRTRVEMDPGTAGHLIVNSLLQPLAENAVEHGDRTETLELTLRVAQTGDALRIEIENTGSLEPGHRKRSSHGIGLENLRRRLDVHYPGRHSFDLQQIEDENGQAHVVATLLLEGEPCSAS